MGRRKPRVFFKNIPIDFPTERQSNMPIDLPIELQSNIFDRLCAKDQSKAMCVSHSWRDFILYSILPKDESQQSSVSLFPIKCLDLKLQQLFHWCSRVMCCRVGPNKLIDSCNGLLLFYHNYGRAQNLTHGVYHYYVMNHVTKQCVAVSKPNGQISRAYSYATLVYDPTKSRFFQIVNFQGHRHVNVFSSKNGIWTTQTLILPKYIIASSWTKKSVYFNGSLYRLSRSGHLVKIKVDIQENVLEQTEAITLPQDCLSFNCQWELSVKGNKLLFVMSKGLNFVVYELVECVSSGVTSCSWCTSHRIQDDGSKWYYLNKLFKLLSFHPYDDVAFFKGYNHLFYYIFIGNNTITDLQQVPSCEILYDYFEFCGIPLVECYSPFACRLNEEHPRVFQRPPIPTVIRVISG
ncbi:uncharacterized protein [Medicago truncatula]|uniref:F-box protein n=1 Tax=Medicago truncatula TaxID=3880 RepID=G7IVR9_MEDTR|nr:uncharacterized protein LOC120579672 [Medicago truncatula]AES68652.1 F-box protein [Medicago truncatula]